MKNIIYLILLVLPIYVVACNNEGPIDGGIHTPFVNKTTLEYLQEIPKFDSVLLLFDRAGLLDEFKNKNTIIVPTNYTVHYYIQIIQEQYRKEMKDENVILTFGDLLTNPDHWDHFVKDSLKMYIIPGELIDYNFLKEIPTYSYLTKSLFGNDVELSLQETRLYTEWFPNLHPMLMNYKWVRNGLDPVGVTIPVTERDLSAICQTNSIITKNGVLHVLEDTHNLFFQRVR